MASRSTTGTFSEESEFLDTTRFENGASRRTRPCRNQKKRQDSVDSIYEPYGLPSSSSSHDSSNAFQDPARVMVDRSPRTENTTHRARRLSKRAIDITGLGSLMHTNSSSVPPRSNKRRMVVKTEEVPAETVGNNPQRIILPPPQRNSPIRNSPVRISSVCNSPAHNSQLSDQASMDGHMTGGVTLPPLCLPEHSTHGGITLPPLRSVLPIDVENYAESFFNFQEETDLENNTDEDMVVVDLTSSSPPYPSPPSIIDLTTSSPVIDLTTPYPPFSHYRLALDHQVNPEVIVIDDDPSDAAPSQIQRVVTQDGNMTPPFSQDRSTTTPTHPLQSRSETFAHQLSSLVNTPTPRGLQLKCAICLDRPKDVSSTPCGHIFCFECISTAVKTQKTCSLCRRSVTKKQIRRLEFKVL